MENILVRGIGSYHVVRIITLPDK